MTELTSLFNNIGGTKGERAEKLFSNNPDIQTWDCAIPLSYLQLMNDRGFNNVSGHFVTVYYHGSSWPVILPISDRGLFIVATLAQSI